MGSMLRVVPAFMLNKEALPPRPYGVNMKNKVLSLMAAGLIAIGVAGPARAGDGPLGSVTSWLGSVTAFIVDVPEGILYHSLYNCPLKTSQYLAESFGDENGAGQNVVGAVLGVPTGILWGIPYGAIAGAKHGIGTGWEKPFSTESYIVVEQ